MSLSSDTALAGGRQNPSYERILWLAGALAVAVVVLLLDFLSLLHGAIAVLYIAVVLLVAQRERKRTVLLTGLGCAVLATVTLLTQHHDEPLDSAYVRYGVSLAAIAVATVLSIRDRDARFALDEQGRILELTHDTVVIHDNRGVIQYWNDGAERLYGWSRAEALGRLDDELLHTQTDMAAVDAALDRGGQWSGELIRARRDGALLVLASRRLARLDPNGRRIGVIETSQDLTEQREAEQARDMSEHRYRSIFRAAGFAAWESDWSEVFRRLRAAFPAGADAAALAARQDLLRHAAEGAVIRDCNAAAVALFEASSPQALIDRGFTGLCTAGGFAALARLFSALLNGSGEAEAEAVFATASGRQVEVVLRVTVVPVGEPWSRAIVMALDVTERNQIRERLEQVSAELAHAARVSVLGQLTASIAHEVNQPLAAIVNYGKSGQRWLSRTPPDIGEALNCLERIVANGGRAAEVISRVRSLSRKAAPRMAALDLGEVIGEAIALVEREARGAGATLVWRPTPDLPPVLGDRVQIQQVVVNLLMNGVQAMAEVHDRPRELRVAAVPAGPGEVVVSVRDSGGGIAGDNPDRIFQPFFTTKSDGMGMGLSICRSIVEGHGGRIFATNNPDAGATLAFSLPSAAPAIAGARGASEPPLLADSRSGI